MARLFPFLLSLTAVAFLTGAALAAQETGAPSPTPTPVAAVGTVPAGGAFQPNYLAAAQRDMPLLRRWQRLPVRVCFIREGGDTPERERCVRSGFDEWTAATGGVLCYRITDTPTDADVLVYLRSVAHLPDSVTTVGNTHTQSRGHWLVSAQMSLATGGPMTPELLTEVAAHEWGHALGIRGHSDDPNDLMYVTTMRTVSASSTVYEAPARLKTPTPRDINTIKTLYADRFAPPAPAAAQAARYRQGG